MGLTVGRLRAHMAGEGGLSLVEMTITLAVLAVILTFALSGLAAFMNRAQSGAQRVDNLNQAESAMDVASKVLRTGTALTSGTSPFVVATATDITFYAALDATGGPRRIRIYVDGSNRLVEVTTLPDAGSVAPNYTYTGASRTRTLAQYVTNGSTPVFTFYDAAGAQVAAPVTGSTLLTIRAVGIQLSISVKQNGRAPATTLVNRVRLPNVYAKAGT